ncbi:MAG: hypothetical protein JWN52_2334 [Actinomycetia bacterium]|nr:hypothetical protein [Actinomycetes bacterium]
MVSGGFRRAIVWVAAFACLFLLMVAAIKVYDLYKFYASADDRAWKKSAVQVDDFRSSLLAFAPHMPTSGQIGLTTNKSKGIAVQSIKTTRDTTAVTVRSVVHYRDTLLPGDAVLFRCYRLDMTKNPALTIIVTELRCSIPT